MTFGTVMSIILAVLIIVRAAMMQSLEDAIIGAVGVIFIGTMIWFKNVWAEYILPFGFWESKAKDYKNAAGSAPAIAFIGWVLLVLMFVVVYFF